MKKFAFLLLFITSITAARAEVNDEWKFNAENHRFTNEARTSIISVTVNENKQVTAINVENSTAGDFKDFFDHAPNGENYTLVWNSIKVTFSGKSISAEDLECLGGVTLSTSMS